MRRNIRTNLDLLREAAIDRKLNLERSVQEVFHPTPAAIARDSAAQAVESPVRHFIERVIDEIRQRPWLSAALVAGAGAFMKVAYSRIPVRQSRSVLRLFRPVANKFEGSLRQALTNVALPLGTALLAKGAEAFFSRREPTYDPNQHRHFH